MRLIDADALRKNAWKAERFSPDMLVVGLGFILDAPTIESPRHDWTPCAEGLPRKETDNVLICYLDKYGFAEVGIGWYWIPNGKWYNDEKGNAIDVLAWQPLPEPYNHGTAKED